MPQSPSRPPCSSSYGGLHCSKRAHDVGDHIEFSRETGEAEWWPRELDEWRDAEGPTRATRGQPVPAAVLSQAKASAAVQSAPMFVGQGLGLITMPNVDICPEDGCGGQMVQRGKCMMCSVCAYGGSCG